MKRAVKIAHIGEHNGLEAEPKNYIPSHGSDQYTVLHYELNLDLRLGANLLNGRATLRARALKETQTLVLDLTGLGMDKASINGQRILKFSQRAGKLRLSLPQGLSAGEEFSLDIRYSGNPAPARGRWGEVGWEELDDGVLVAGQPTGAPTWFPCNDIPSDKASYRFTVTTDADYTVICNGLLLSHSKKSSREIWVYEQSAPMASYLATVQIGKYQLLSVPVSEASSLPINVAVSKKYFNQAAFALSRQREMIDCFIERFGAYPFPNYMVVVTEDELEIPLEAQSLSIIGSNHATTQWESQRLIAHELSHQWFGNSLTLKNWQDIWLHEGFACFAEWVWSEDSGSMTMTERATAAHYLLSNQPQNIVVGNPGPALMFDDRVYKRGALALYALMTAVGELAFFKFLKQWTAQNKYSSVTTADFIAEADACFSQTGIDGSIFDSAALLAPWLNEKPLPPLATSGII